MRGITTTFAAAILTLGTAVAVAAPALATEGEFLNDLRIDGFTGSDPVLLDWGYRICDDWQDGINRDKIIEERLPEHRRVDHPRRRQVRVRVGNDVPVLMVESH